MAFVVLTMLTILSVGGVQGELQLFLYTVPPTVGDKLFFCDSIKTTITISCNYSSSFRINPSVVINGVPSSVSDLDEQTYTGSYTDTGGVELQFPVSIDFSNYTFSCKLNKTVASKTITLLADFQQCSVDINATVSPADSATTSPEVSTAVSPADSATTSPEVSTAVSPVDPAASSPEVFTGAPAPPIAPTSPLHTLPSQTPALNGNGTVTTSPPSNGSALLVHIVVAVIAGLILMIVVASPVIAVAVALLCRRRRKKGRGGGGVGGGTERAREDEDVVHMNQLSESIPAGDGSGVGGGSERGGEDEDILTDQQAELIPAGDDSGVGGGSERGGEDEDVVHMTQQAELIPAGDDSGVGGGSERDGEDEDIVMNQQAELIPGSHNQLEGNPPGQTMMKRDGPQEGDGPEDSDDLEEGDDSEEGEELLERDPEEQDQQMEQYSNSNAAEEDEVGVRPHPVGGGDSEENLNIATEESSGGSNLAQSVMVVPNQSLPHTQSPSPSSNPPLEGSPLE